MAAVATDRNLLFGLLALQNGPPVRPTAGRHVTRRRLATCHQLHRPIFFLPTPHAAGRKQRADKELKAPPALRGSAMVARPTRPQIFAVN